MLTQRIKTKRNNIETRLVVAVYQEGDYFVAYCPALEISSYSQTVEQAKTEFEQEVQIFFSETIRKGTLEKLLLKYGWTLQSNNFTPPALSIGLTNKLKNYPHFTLREQRVSIPYINA